MIPSQLYFRLAASAINAFFALSLFYVLKMTFSGKNITGFWLMFLIIFPLIFHSIHIYPELPAAMMMMSACIFVFFSKKNYFLSGLFISFIFWFHIKYYPPVIILGLIIIFKLIKNREMKKLLHFCIFPVLSLILLLIYCKCLYGSFSPTAIFPKADYFTIPLLFKVKAFLAYFLDQRDGLLIYTPVFLLAFLGLKREVKNRNILLIICFSYIFFHAFTTIRGAYSPAGRPVMFVSWILIIFILNYYTNTLRVKSKYIYKLLAGFSIFVLIWLMYYPFFMYQPVFHGTPQVGSSILHFLGSDSINLIQFFPSFSNLLNPNHMANYLWLGVLLFIFVVYYSGLFKRPVLEKGRNIISFLLFFLFVFLICFFPHVHLRDRNRFSDEKISFFNNSKHFQYKIEPKIFKIKPGDNYNLFFDLKKCKKKKITFYFTNTDVVDIVVRNGKKLLFRSNKMKKSVFTLKLLLLKKIKVKNKIVAHIGIETKAQSSKSLLFLKIL